MTTAIASSYTVQANPDDECYDVIAPDGSIFTSYSFSDEGKGAAQELVDIFNADTATLMPSVRQLRSETALVERLEAQFGGDRHGDSALGPVDDGRLAVYTVNATEARRVHDLLAYIWLGPMSGEWDEQEPEVLIEGHLYVFSIDTTKSRRDDVPDAWDGCKGILSEGSAVRKTNKAGPGTKGTRAIQGIGPVLMAWG